MASLLIDLINLVETPKSVDNFFYCLLCSTTCFSLSFSSKFSCCFFGSFFSSFFTCIFCYILQVVNNRNTCNTFNCCFSNFSPLHMLQQPPPQLFVTTNTAQGAMKTAAAIFINLELSTSPALSKRFSRSAGVRLAPLSCVYYLNWRNICPMKMRVWIIRIRSTISTGV